MDEVFRLNPQTIPALFRFSQMLQRKQIIKHEYLSSFQSFRLNQGNISVMDYHYILLRLSNSSLNAVVHI